MGVDSNTLGSAALTPQEARKIKKIEDATESARNKLRNHHIYSLIKTTDDLRVFMSYHYYCVWDFMNLIKKLQITYTCCDLPFRPAVGEVMKQIRRFLNEINLEEETDEIEGGFISHFSYYNEAFKAICENGEDLNEFGHVTDFFNEVTYTHHSYGKVISLGSIPSAAKVFMKATYQQVMHENPLVTASAFTFGREDLLPHIFKKLIAQPLLKQDERLTKFEIYLDRHIELDGDCHSILAKKLVASLCKSEEDWQLAEKWATFAIESRLLYWDEVAKKIEKAKRNSKSSQKSGCCGNRVSPF